MGNSPEDWNLSTFKHYASFTHSKDPPVRNTVYISVGFLRNPSEITIKPAEEIIRCQLSIKLGHFTEDEVYTVMKTIECRKAAGLSEIPAELWKTKYS